MVRIPWLHFPLTSDSYLFLGDDYTGRPTPATGVDGTSDKNPVDGSKTHSKTAQKILRLQKQPPAPTLFIGNLGFETTEDAIRELFEAHKEKKAKEEARDDAKPRDKTTDVWIRKIRMGTFEDSGLCKGYMSNLFYVMSPAD